MEQIKCQLCGTPFTQGKRGRPRKFCTVDCTLKAHKPAKKEVTQRNCDKCGQTTNNPRFCSRECRHRYHAAQARQRKRKYPPGVYRNRKKKVVQRIKVRKCQTCDLVIWGRWLCDECRRKRVRENNRASKKRNGYVPDKQIQKARRMGAIIETIDRRKVYAKDNYICQLCNQPTDPSAHHWDNNYPSIDHIKPLAKGGNHTYDNVQTAHRGCNSRKQARYEQANQIG